MPEGDDAFGELVKQAAEGSDFAAEEIWKQCGPRVFRTIQQRLRKRTARFESADIAQAVWMSFFHRRTELGQFDRLDGLIAYLEGVAENKVLMEHRRHFGTAARSVDREVNSLSEDVGIPIADSGPTPSLFAMANEMWEQLLASTPLHYQQVIFMKLDGKTHEEIAKELGLSIRTIHRVLKRIEKSVRL